MDHVTMYDSEGRRVELWAAQAIGPVPGDAVGPAVYMTVRQPDAKADTAAMLFADRHVDELIVGLVRLKSQSARALLREAREEHGD